MPRRPRIDLDGVPLADPAVPMMPLAIFRQRTTEGLLLQIPESGEVIVPWALVTGADIDLVAGTLELEFDPRLPASQNWLRGASRLAGRWLDRVTLDAGDTGATRIAVDS